MILGENIYLRTLEINDLDFLYDLENDQANWEVSNTLVPFSKEILLQYIQSAQDIHTVKQVRFVICLKKNNQPIGAIDLFDYDPMNLRVGVGVVILEKHRERGVAKEALKHVIDYCFSTLLLHNIYCNILSDNQSSINLFQSQGFKQVGVKKDWCKTSIGWKDEILYQLSK